MTQPDETHRGNEIVVDIFGGCWRGWQSKETVVGI